jgi:hypothetical protein
MAVKFHLNLDLDVVLSLSPTNKTIVCIMQRTNPQQGLDVCFHSSQLAVIWMMCDGHMPHQTAQAMLNL